MTTLTDEVARAIARAGQPDQVDALATSEWLPEARAALQIVAQWLREQNEASDGDIDFIIFHLEKEMG